MKNIVVLVSGSGTNLQAILDAQTSGIIKGGRVTCVISSKPDAYAITRARENSISSRVLERREFSNVKLYTTAILEAIKEENADLIVYAGFMTILDEQISQAYPNKIMNVHPALIPSFCGKGYYGLKVHQAVLDSGVKITGATVHFADEVCDGGAIILQKTVEVLDNDTAEILQKRVMQEAEWDILPRAVSLFCDDKIEVVGKKTRIIK